MGTKNNPGAFDCYEAAEPDEPMFILLARDPVAPWLVELWAEIRKGDFNAARLTLDYALLSAKVMTYRTHPTQTAKLEEAETCARAMREWLNKNRPRKGLGMSPVETPING